MSIVPCREKPCEECGAFFMPKTSAQKYCETACNWRAKERKRVASGYYQRPEVIERTRAGARESYKRTYTPKVFTPVMATCAHCGEQFTKAHQHKRYCSESCVKSADIERRQKPAEVKPCKGCGQDFTVTRTMQYCSVPCRNKINRQIERDKKRAAPKQPRKPHEPQSYPATCTFCQELYEARSKRSKYCSEKCRFEEKAAAEGKRDCRRCSTPLTDTHYARYCPGCQLLNKRESRAKRGPRNRDHGQNHRSRARHYGVPYEPIKRSDIYERDGWRCGICSKKINQDLAYPHQMSVSLDHVIPLSKGGGHLRNNVQAAHLKCNVHKGADADYVQPLLVG